jgi:hypothetical protein
MIQNKETLHKVGGIPMIASGVTRRFTITNDRTRFAKSRRGRITCGFSTEDILRVNCELVAQNANMSTSLAVPQDLTDERFGSRSVTQRPHAFRVIERQ